MARAWTQCAPEQGRTEPLQQVELSARPTLELSVRWMNKAAVQSKKVAQPIWMGLHPLFLPGESILSDLISGWRIYSGLEVVESISPAAMLAEEPFLTISNQRFDPGPYDEDCIEVLQGAEERFIVPIRCASAKKLDLG